MNYSAVFHRIDARLDEQIMRATLAGLHDLSMGFFPAELATARDVRITLTTPAEYTRDLIPQAFYVDKTSARIPFHASGGMDFTFVESQRPRVVPASLAIEFSSEVMQAQDWRLDRLAALFRAVVSNFAPTYGYLYDQQHRARPAYQAGMFSYDRHRVPVGVFWINYYGPEWANNVGRMRLERLHASCPLWEWQADGGVLFAIQAEAYNEALSNHRSRQLALEEQLGLAAVQAKYPNPGL